MRKKTVLLYLIAGGLTTAVNYLLFFLFMCLQGAELDLASMLGAKSENPAMFNKANIPAIIGAVIFAYPVNKLMVFKTRRGNIKELSREAGAFFASRAAALVFETGAGAFLVAFLRFPELTAKLLLTVAVVILNYIFSVKLVFRGSDKR